jgi:dTDP-4-dehydrorhamnose 3,5-epimerase
VTDWYPTRLSGVLRANIRVNVDQRGSLADLWRVDQFDNIEPFRQISLSRSGPGVLRGMHFHDRQDITWVVTEGSAFVALVDLDADASEPLTFTMQPYTAVFIPRGVAHGFRALSPLDVVYMSNRESDGTDEWGFRYDDAPARIRWPLGYPRLSERDASAPPLSLALTMREARRSR